MAHQISNRVKRTPAGNWILHSRDREASASSGGSLQSIHALPADLPLDKIKLKYTWNSPIGLYKRARQSLAAVGVENVGQLIAAYNSKPDDTVYRASADACYSGKEYIRAVLDHLLKEVPHLSDPLYVPPKILPIAVRDVEIERGSLPDEIDLSALSKDDLKIIAEAVRREIAQIAPKVILDALLEKRQQEMLALQNEMLSIHEAIMAAKSK